MKRQFFWNRRQYNAANWHIILYVPANSLFSGPLFEPGRTALFVARLCLLCHILPTTHCGANRKPQSDYATTGSPGWESPEPYLCLAFFHPRYFPTHNGFDKEDIGGRHFWKLFGSGLRPIKHG